MAERRLHDRYFKQAKAEGYLARSAYKLLEIDRRHRLLRPGMRVLDVGCAPGSWLQVASAAVGERGVVVGIDLKAVRAPIGPNVRTMVGDAERVDPAELLALGGIAAGAGAGFDVVLSDMAPDTSGHGDDLVSARLCRLVLGLAPRVLRGGGSLAMKIFEGSEYAAVVRETSALFAAAKGLKPDATRSVSREMYIIATGFRGGLVGGQAFGGEGVR